MGLFHPNYNNPGPGVRKDEPRKKGAARFFEILGRDMGDLFRANLLCAICFVPALALIFLGILGRAILLAVLGALVCTAVLYWDKIMELVCKVKSSVEGRKFCGCDESEDYAD